MTLNPWSTPVCVYEREWECACMRVNACSWVWGSIRAVTLRIHPLNDLSLSHFLFHTQNLAPRNEPLPFIRVYVWERVTACMYFFLALSFSLTPLCMCLSLFLSHPHKLAPGDEHLAFYSCVREKKTTYMYFFLAFFLSHPHTMCVSLSFFLSFFLTHIARHHAKSILLLIRVCVCVYVCVCVWQRNGMYILLARSLSLNPVQVFVSLFLSHPHN